MGNISSAGIPEGDCASENPERVIVTAEPNPDKTPEEIARSVFELHMPEVKVQRDRKNDDFLYKSYVKHLNWYAEQRARQTYEDAFWNWYRTAKLEE